MTRSIVLIVSVLFISHLAFGQDPFTKKELSNGLSKRATLKLADRYYAESSFYSSADNYKLYLKKDPQSRYANFWLAMALYQARDYEGAEKYFARYYSIKPGKKDKPKKWEKQDKDFFRLGHLYYGMVLHRTGKYELAKTHLQKFKGIYHHINPEYEATQLKLAKLEMDGCDSEMVLGKQKVKVKRLSDEINTPYTQSSPFMYSDNELYYSSLDQRSLVNYTGQRNKKYAYIYKSTREGADWPKGVKLPEEINEPGYFTGNGTFNASRTRFYFTKCMERDDDRALCNIFVVDVKNGKIAGTPTRLPEGINYQDKYTSTHPTVRQVDSKKEIIYYSTDRDGGKGGMDIWYTQRNAAGEFMAPRPLSAVNTVGDEVTPFFDDSVHTLYFSSNGLPGMGGYDIFRSSIKQGEGSTWSEPVNMGKILNTGADDLYFTRSGDQTHGCFTSNREGSVPLAGISTASDDIYYWEFMRFAVQGKVSRLGHPNANMDSARFNLYVQNADGTRELLAVDSTGTGGHYFFNLNPDQDYVVEASRPGYLPASQNVTTRGLENDDTLIQNLLVSKDSYVIFGKVMEENPYKAIMNAAISVYEVNGSAETLIRELPARDSFYYVTVPTGKDYKIMAHKEGFFANSSRASTRNLDPETDSVRADIKLRDVVLNKEYTLSNILYEFDQSRLTPVAKLVLDTLFQIMKENPSFVIELSSHTDGKGKPQYNQNLSQARAQSCVDYLVKKGIIKKRMKAKGYGMNKPVAPNTNPDGSDNPDGRALNRRTEFKVLRQ
jgi:outer membrane protein OmpA-like peptidoglycan-associated protein/tetratricopeptide (TPR) repeat protein